MKSRLDTLKVSPVRRTLAASIAVVFVVVLLELAVGNVRGYHVVSRSMDPTLKVGDMVLSIRLPESFDIRGKVIAFEADDGGSNLTKRVIGESGDKVDVKNGRVIVNGQMDPYSLTAVRVRPASYNLGSNDLFVAGDNRRNSFDSLDHGPIPKSRLVGIVALRYWPPERMGIVH